MILVRKAARAAGARQAARTASRVTNNGTISRIPAAHSVSALRGGVGRSVPFTPTRRSPGAPRPRRMNVPAAIPPPTSAPVRTGPGRMRRAANWARRNPYMVGGAAGFTGYQIGGSRRLNASQGVTTTNTTGMYGY